MRKLPRPGLQRRDQRWERCIDALDPIAGAHAIFVVLFDRIFPLEIVLASELGQLRTFAFPSISRLLHATGEYERDGQKRVDDTRAILTEIVAPGPQSRRGAEMIDHLDRIHGHYRIANDDYLVTLAALAVGPIEHIDTFAHRPMREVERVAFYEVWRQVGVRMGIRDVPPTWQAMRAFRNAYEARAARHHPANEAVARALLDVIGAMLPRALRGLVEPSVTWLLGAPHLSGALGLRPPSARERTLIAGTFAARRRALRYITAFNHAPFSQSELFRALPSYPQGYDRLHLGPRKLIARMLREASAPTEG